MGIGAGSELAPGGGADQLAHDFVQVDTFGDSGVRQVMQDPDDDADLGMIRTDRVRIDVAADLEKAVVYDGTLDFALDAKS